SGPGGQGVNTTDSRVQLRFDIGTTTALDETQRQRALQELRTRLSGTVLVINAAEHRSQRRNRTAARERLSTLLRDALVPPRPRKTHQAHSGFKAATAQSKAHSVRSEAEPETPEC